MEYNLTINCETIGGRTVLGTLMNQLMDSCKDSVGVIDDPKFQELVNQKGKVIVSGYNLEFLEKKFPEQQITRRDLVLEDERYLKSEGWEVVLNL